MDPSGEWWQSFFLSGQYRLEEHVSDPERTKREVDLIQKGLGLEPGDRVLDLCCGIGRHSAALSLRGIEVVGVDFTPASLVTAAYGGGRYVRGDMRHIPLRGAFDAAFCVFTSFGYFEDDADHQLVIDEVGRLLKPGGRFLLDVLNPHSLARRFTEQMWSELPDGFLLNANKLDLVRGRSLCDWTFVRGTERHTFPTSIRLFTVPELARMMSVAGLDLVETYGNFLGEPLSLNTNRQIVVAEKLA
jgi:SAM-dependent methyltransferase